MKTENIIYKRYAIAHNTAYNTYSFYSESELGTVTVLSLEAAKTAIEDDITSAEELSSVWGSMPY